RLHRQPGAAVSAINNSGLLPPPLPFTGEGWREGQPTNVLSLRGPPHPLPTSGRGELLAQRLAGAKFGDLRLVVAQLAQHLVAVRADRRADVPGRLQPCGEADRTGQLALRRPALARYFGDHTTRLELRVLDRLGQLQHRLDAGIQGGEAPLPLGQVVLLDLDLDLALERLLILG